MGDILPFKKRRPLHRPLQAYLRRDDHPCLPLDEPPHDWAGACGEIENEGGVSLTEPGRKSLWMVLAAYAESAPVAGTYPSRTEIKSRLVRTAAAAKKLRDLLNEIEKENPIGTWPLIHRKLEVDIEIDRMPAALRALAVAANAAADDIPGHFKTRAPGRPQFPQFDELVERLAVIYSRMGGNVSAAYSESDQSPAGPFVRFCRSAFARIEAALPDDVAWPRTAFGDAVRNSLKRGENAGWSDPWGQRIADALDPTP